MLGVSRQPSQQREVLGECIWVVHRNLSHR
jgi:hypothetical protein